jgi:hypothetical protein
MKFRMKNLLDAISVFMIIALVIMFGRSIFRGNPDYVTLAIAISGIFFFVTSRFQKE